MKRYFQIHEIFALDRILYHLVSIFLHKKIFKWKKKHFNMSIRYNVS